MVNLLKYLYDDGDNLEIIKLNRYKGIIAVRKYLHSVCAAYICVDSPKITNKEEFNFDVLSMSTKEKETEIVEMVNKYIQDATESELYVDEHVYKLTAIVLEAYKKGIIDINTAYNAVIKANKPFVFQSLLPTMGL